MSAEILSVSGHMMGEKSCPTGAELLIRPGPRGPVLYRKDTPMATYTSMGRSNHFSVRDLQKLKDLVVGTGIELQQEGESQVVLLDTEGTDWMICGQDCEDDIYLPDVIAEYLEPGEVVVFQSIGNERFRYLGGHSVAVSSEGKQVWIHLSDIYAAAAKEFGVDASTISLAEY